MLPAGRSWESGTQLAAQAESSTMTGKKICIVGSGNW